MHVYKYSPASKKQSAQTNEKTHNFRCGLYYIWCYWQIIISKEKASQWLVFL